MGSTPQPPRAPAPPPPPRSSSNVVAIVLLILALIIVVCGVSIYAGIRFLSHTVQVNVAKDEQGKEKDVSIKTPIGNFEVQKNADVSEASLGLPLYPGAQRVAADGSAGVSMEFPGENRVRINVGKFDTTDDLDKVEKFYHDRICNQVTKFTQHDPQGKTVFEIKDKDEERVVALKSSMTGTRIELVRVMHGQNQVN
jgi:hypothetical protein